MIELEEAQARLLAMATPLPVETLPVGDALGRYLAEPLLARRMQPAADLSAMDGYAVSGAGPWQVIGESRAGHPFAGSLDAGEAVRISTGALLPQGDVEILLQEDATRDGDRVDTTEPPSPGRHIRRAGFDFRDGDRLIEAGARIDPAVVALALSAGNSHVAVRRAPKVTILDSGDELSPDPADCPPHRIPATNGAMLAAMIAALPCEIRRIGPVPDNRAALASALAQAADCDVLVTSGGASVGDHDLIRPALEDWGARLDFWKVAIKPGKPLIVAQRGGQVVLGLPGNPVSSYVTAFLFLLPLLRALSGAARPLPLRVELPVAVRLPEGGSRREFIRAAFGHDGLAPVDEQDSSALSALARADALIDRPVGAPVKEAGDRVAAYLLENG